MTATIDVSLDLFQEIERLKRERNAIILAHYYQDPDIQDIADYLGDSLGLSQQAAKTEADVILFCGVHFMAETAKILNPAKTVLMPDLEAGCSLADSAPADKIAAWKAQYPGHVLISYINCSAEVKALSDIICTSSNAVKIVQQLPPDQKILFAPDRHLGRWVMQQTGRDMVLWPGACEVHEQFAAKKLTQAKVQHPGAKVIAHPECQDDILVQADYIGSTSALLAYTQKDPATTFIVVTESGIIHQMKKASPDKTFIPALPEDNSCNCSQCPYMRVQSLEKAYLALRDLQPQVTVPAAIAAEAIKPIQRMLEMSK
jgi:quinolinate synthase